ncbi:hypothetical protein [Escherichia coli]|uniref:hypothetical protein n=1 Tax=Escherichia coli TaxID=562 RepID=UPI00200E6074|nr:hypothetical protein [Escherichia coli]MCL0910366.1 hypothetical protein [Escherichia coli]
MGGSGSTGPVLLNIIKHYIWYTVEHGGEFFTPQSGQAERGFDWLGVWFDATGPTGIAPRAKENHRARRLRPEELARRRGLSEEAVRQRVQQYEARWSLWAERQMKAALPCLYFE